ncbi:hypothetical protein B7463_g185, partial [Scytalidium lignicola]
MAAKLKSNLLNGVHTAGIYADMTVDGPEIGTLVVIVDRAKNLPNRKSIGKQDPYCAARLGKEAKKTETDRRGGQTPRWDQELRFTVHDSPDYFQLKVSVFNDDKRTDLIGETWINLKEVVIPGGGQNDLWHNLSCKGKYAGEIRIEITYYDTRPKQEKPERAKQTFPTTSTVQDGQRESVGGPRQPKPVKRRPLPSDPVTGAPPPPPAAIPDHVQPPTQYQAQAYIPNQSPLQTMEYQAPQSRYNESQGYRNNPNTASAYSTPQHFAGQPSAPPIPNDRYESYDNVPANDYMPTNTAMTYGRQFEEESIDPRNRYNSQELTYERPHPNDLGPLPSPGGPPPPPPAHGNRHGPSVSAMTSYDYTPTTNEYQPPNTVSYNQYDNAQPDVYHQVTSDFPQQNSYHAPSPLDEGDEGLRSSPNNQLVYQQPQPRHHTYDSGHRSDLGSLQPTVEDAPPSPVPFEQHSGRKESSSRGSQFENHHYDEVSAPAPLNLSSRGSTGSGNAASSFNSNSQYSSNMNGYTPTESYTDRPVSSRSYKAMSQQQPHPSEDNQLSRSQGSYGIPALPPSLVPGIDPQLAQEISERIYGDKRASYAQGAGNSTRVRYPDPSQYQSARPHRLSYHEPAQPPYMPPTDDHQGRPPTATAVPIAKPRAISPDPRTPARKPVSPSPGRSSTDGRRLSGVPFGPDSYNALNPSISSGAAVSSISEQYDTSNPDPDAKIITHDGREIDPSDHIPESNYAPLHETKGPKYASQLPDRNYRPPPPVGAQQTPPSSRRPLKVAARPQSMITAPTVYQNGPPQDPSTPPSGRNRLQKRMSTQPAQQSSPLAPVSSYQENSYTPRSLPRSNTGDYPNENYAPSSSYGGSPGYGGSPSYGGSSGYGGSPGGYSGSPGYRASAGPPIPAKLPIAAPPPPQYGSDSWALVEEMKSIDLGTGRGRRRAY